MSLINSPGVRDVLLDSEDRKGLTMDFDRLQLRTLFLARQFVVSNCGIRFEL